MGTDALLAAILSCVLRPSAQPKEYGRAAVTVADIEEVRADCWHASGGLMPRS